MIHHTILRSLLAVMLVFPAASAASPLDDLTRLLREGKTAEILSSIEGILPSGEQAFVAGLAAFRLGRFERAVSLFESASRSSRIVPDYALLHLSHSHARMKEYRQAVAPLERLIAEFPESRLVRPALFQRGDLLAEAGMHDEAIQAYETAIRRFPSGRDAIRASLRQAVSMLERGDRKRAVRQLRTIWITSPSAPEAKEAAEALQKLRLSGTAVPPFTDEERFKRGVTLAETGHHRQAIEELQPLASSGDDGLRRRVSRKIGESLFKTRNYQKAHEIFDSLSRDEKDPSYIYWSARSLARMGKRDDAVTLFRTVVENHPRSNHADESLYHQALIAAESGNTTDAITLLRRLIGEYPKSTLVAAARWEIALLSIVTKRMEEAAAELLPLLDDDRYRERSLFWLSVTAERRKESPESYRNRLATEYPLGFYASYLRHEGKLPPLEYAPLDSPLETLLPKPTDFERERFLIRCGLTEDGMEELRLREKSGLSPARRNELARIYLEQKRYDAIYRLGRNFMPRPGASPLSLALLYPPAYLERIRQTAATYRIPPALLLALVRAESSYDPRAVSPAGAVGLTQLLPSTARSMMKGVESDQLFDPELNLSLGARHLRDLLDRYAGDPLPALAAYNAGSTPVDRWLARAKGVDRILFIETIPYRETREYVKKIIAATTVHIRLYPELSADAVVTGLLFGKRTDS